jgi:co-chaperonin GroES (HSP10)
MTKLRALGTRLLIERVEAEKITAGGIVLQHSQEVPRARVLDVGPQVKEDIVIGNILVVDWSRVGQVRFENTTHYMVDESTILAVVE